MKNRLASFWALLLFGCGGADVPPPPVPQPPPTPAAPVGASAVAHAAPAPNSDPSVLTDAQRARDKSLAPKVEAILDAFGNYDGRLSPDGKRIAFRSNRGGVPELFVAEVGKPSEPPKKIVAGPERVESPEWSPDGKWITFLRDQGADENYRVYRVRPDGSDLAALTPGEALHRDEPLFGRRKPDRIVFTARRTTSPETLVSVATLPAGDEKVVATDPGPSFGVSVTPDGSRALLVRFQSPTNQSAWEVDLGSGKSKRVYPAEGRSAAISTLDYSADGKRIFLATDEGGEQNVLLALDATTFAEKARYVQDKPKTARIASLTVSPRGDRLAVMVDAGNRTEVRVLDAQTFKPTAEVKAPLGRIGLGPFADDGRSFTIAESTPDAPPDLFLVDASSGAAKPLRDDKRPGLADLPGLDVTITQVPAHDGLSIPLHHYLPKNRAASARLPTIVLFHGGPASSSFVGFNWMARWFTSQGFAFVEPNIRGSTGFGRAYEMADNREKRADALKDLETVNKWLRAQPWCDGDRLVIYGGSYGGYLVLMGLTRQSSIWRAGVDYVGVANLFTFLKSTDQGIRTAFVEEFGDLEKDQALLEEFSPMRDKDKIVAPLFVYQGQNDPRVPRPESDQVVLSLRARGVPIEYMVAPDEGHSLERRANRIEFLTRVARFLDEQTKAR
jgi:dipeptidyl aminopeptidase/acylaminoacyl peptidase